LDYCRWGWPYTYYTNYWLMLHARLLSREGAVTTQEFQLTRSRGPQTQPAAAFDGRNFLVTWHDKRYAGPSGPDFEWKLYAQLINEHGGIDEPGFETGAFPFDAGSALCFANGQYVSVCNAWQYVWVKILREEITSRPALRNFVRLPSDFLQFDLVADNQHLYSIDLSTNLLDWLLASSTSFGDRVVFFPGRCVVYSPFPGADRSFCRATDGTYACIRNLRRIQAAKAQWAFDQDRSNLESPLPITALGDYLRTEPICPNGGTYGIEDVKDRPNCTLGAVAGHTL